MSAALNRGFRTALHACAVTTGLGIAGCATVPRVATTTPAATVAAQPAAAAPATAESRACLGAHQTGIPSFASQRVDRLPEVLQQAPPTYPESALEAGTDGTVVLAVLVCADGSIHDVRITRSVSMLDGAAIDAVHLWSFQPAQLAGEAVAAWTEARVEFKLPPKGAATQIR